MQTLDCQNTRRRAPRNHFFRAAALAACTIALQANHIRAAAVGPAGYTNEFTIQPPAADWATSSRTGTAADTYDPDTDVGANASAGAVTNQTTLDTGNPPPKVATATWSSSGFYLQTRPTGNRYTSLMGKFVNNTGTNATQVAFSYLFTITGAGVAEDAGKGTRLYYSLTGTSGGWTNLAALNTTASANGSSTVGTNLALNWTNGAALYLLWVDDNANALGDDSGNQIDNFSLRVTAGVPLTLACQLTTPGSNDVFVSGASITASAIVSAGTPPYSVEYFTNSGASYTLFSSAGSSATPPYSFNLGNPPVGTYHVYAVATDSAGTPASVFSFTNTFFVADLLGLDLTAPSPGSTVDNLTEVIGAAMVSGGTTPYSVQFLLDGIASAAPLTSTPWERNFGPLAAGDHTVGVTVTDAHGWVTNALPRLIHVTGPLAATLTPTNGATFVYGEPVLLSTIPGGGTAPYTVTFYTNDQPAGTLDAPPFTTNLGVLPPGSYSAHARVSDSSTPVAQEIFSATNAITVLPNPLTAALANPTNGQSATANQPFTLTANAAVALPLTVSRVEFFLDEISVGADSNAPYAASLANPAAGTHTAYVVAADSLGRTMYSATNTVTFVVDPLANNNFANRFALGTPASATGANAGANTETGEPTSTGGFGGTTWGATLWWKWTAPASGPATIDTFGSSFNTYLAVYTGAAVNGLTLVGRNDNAPGLANVSLVSFNAQQGTEYQIQVGGVRTGGGGGGTIATGNIQLHVAMPPTVSLTSPTNGNVFFSGTNILLSANATSVVASIVRVDFYRGTTWLATVSNAPYTAILSNAPPGTNSLSAVATDSLGQATVSSTVNVLVANPGITLIAPADGATFTTTNPLTVSAFTLVSPGAVTNVEFFVDNRKFGQDTNAPFNAVWGAVSAGSHRLTASAQDDSGNTWLSAPVNIAVARSLVASNSIWRYLDDGSDQGTNWYAADFEDDGWASGPAPLGYGDSNGRLVLTTNSFGADSNDKFVTTYYRQTFAVSNVTDYTNMLLNIQRDDGAIVYVNGRELSRFNMPFSPVTYSTFASGNANDDGGTTFTISFSPGLLRDGNNQFAVEIHQDSANSSDIWFELELLGVPKIDRNIPPLVAIYDPTNTVFLAPSLLFFNATATDPDGSISRVEFFADGVKFSDGGASPGSDSYAGAWMEPPIGAHTVTAVATDDHGAASVSPPLFIDVYDAVGSPLAQITSPASGAVLQGPTNLLLTATARALTGVTNVQFLANGVEIGNDPTPPYSILWTSSFLSNGLVAVASDTTGARGTSPVVSVTITIPPTNVLAPTIATQIPPAYATVTNLTSISIVFSERVQHVDAVDLLINGIPATNVTGSGSNYVFSFPQPPYGEVEIAFAAGHGITDFGFPSDLPFFELDEASSWEYDLIDRTPPVVIAKTPGSGVTVSNLSTIAVTFSEPVSGVDAGDLLVNGTPAYGSSGGGSSYLFNVVQPPSGTINITWATNHGIVDQSPDSNAFNRVSSGATWAFTLDARTILVQSNSTWNYLKGLAEASTPADAWRQPGFDDSSWTSSRAPFLYGESSFTNASIPGTDLGDMATNAYSSLYLRRTFVVPNAGAVTNLLLNHQSDDGFIAWLNGVEVFRYNMPTGAIAFNGSAATTVNENGGNNGVPYILVSLTNAPAALVNGLNTLAVHAFNVVTTPASSDFVFNAQLYTFLSDAGVEPPRLAQADPEPGDVFFLTNITVTFSEPVANVDAADFLVNGVAASSVSSSTNSTYTFGFNQPPYGDVAATWATNHGIVDFDEPPKSFDGTVASSILRYSLINPSAPTVAGQLPPASGIVTGLTAITVTFSEPVGGVEASDLLINGLPASGLVSATNTTYTFDFAQPVFGPVTIRWATNHGIADLESPANGFDASRPANIWAYTLVDPAPAITLTSPTNGAYILAPATIPLRATATDNDGSIVLVEFFEGAAKLGEASNAPYTFAWSAVPEGVYTFRAVATDDSGLSATSAPVSISVVTNLPAVLTRGPYLQIGSPTGAVVRWRTDQYSDATVFYGTDAASLTNSASQNFATNEHIVAIGGLVPDTKYFYSVGSGSQRLAGTNGPASDFWFKTSPLAGATSAVRLWVVGDSGTAGNGSATRVNSVRDAYYNFAATNGPADLFLMLGDNAYNSGQDSEYQAAVFNIFPTLLRNHFVWPTLGNHESSQSTTANDFPYLNIFSLPHNGEAGGVPSGTQKYYSFDYANVHLVCLDSMTSGRTTNTAMAQWLRDDLSSTTQDWVIAFFHHPPYTKGSHDSDAESDLVDIRGNIVPILERYGVDLVLCGHSHVHERSYLLNGHYGLSSTLTPAMKIDAGDGREDGLGGAYRKNAAGQGVVYCVAGSSGQTGGGSLNHPAHFLSLNELGSMIIDVRSNRLDALFLNNNSVISDHFTLLRSGPPGVPAHLAVLAIGTNQAQLTWDDVGDEELGYIVERSLDGIQFTRIATNAMNVTTLLDSGLLANTTYFYRIIAYNAAGESGVSPAAQAFTGNTPPLLAAIPDFIASVLTPLRFTNSAVDADVPPNVLTFSLDAGAPTNARVLSPSGFFAWKPTRSQAPGTYAFTVRVRDDGVPPLDAARSFQVFVSDYIEATVGSTVLRAGDDGSVPIETFSSAALAGLQCVLHVPGERLTNLTVETLAPAQALVSLQSSGPDTAVLTFTPAAGLTLQFTQHLARLHFTAVPGQVSAFVPLRVLGITAVRADTGLPPSTLANDGRAVVIEQQPLVEALLDEQGNRLLMLFGKSNANYHVEFTTDAAHLNSWTSMTQVAMTNLSHALSATNTPPVIFFRARE